MEAGPRMADPRNLRHCLRIPGPGCASFSAGSLPDFSQVSGGEPDARHKPHSGDIAAWSTAEPCCLLERRIWTAMAEAWTGSHTRVDDFRVADNPKVILSLRRLPPHKKAVPGSTCACQNRQFVDSHVRTVWSRHMLLLLSPYQNEFQILRISEYGGDQELSLLESIFYFFMSLLVAAVIFYGFSHTIDQGLIHPKIPRPRLLYFHAALFTGWLVFFILQSLLVRAHNVRIHRTIGWFGAGMGALIPPVGVATAVTMARFDMMQLKMNNAAADMIIPMWDMVAFTPAFVLAIYWRKKPEFHRRLILIATGGGMGTFSGVAAATADFLCRRGFTDSAGCFSRLDGESEISPGLLLHTSSFDCRADRRDVRECS
jgi:hypothetical protein